MRYGGVLSVVAVSLLTAACGSTETQRAATGGLAGVGIGALAGGPLGAVIGGLAGGAAGAVMPEGADTLALNAIHKEQNVASGALNKAGYGTEQAQALERSHEASSERVRQAQIELQREGLYHGPIDGIVGQQTRDALTAYQSREGLQQTARLDQQTLDRLNLPAPQTAQGQQATTGSGTSTPGPMLSKDQVRDRLQSSGFQNISDLNQQSDGIYTARADRGDNTYDLRVNGHSGHVVSQHQVAQNQQSQQNQQNQSSNSPPANAAPANAAPSSASDNTSTSTSTSR
jgi:peptidoglycan hydrolase-like protein with peptidoglycan-binding domain